MLGYIILDITASDLEIPLKLFLKYLYRKLTNVGCYNYKYMEKTICKMFEANNWSKISSICTNSENMQDIDQNIPQFYDF